MSGVIAAAGITATAGLAGGLMQAGKGSGGVQTQTQQSMIPGGIEQRDTDNYRLLVDALNNMPGPYTGNRVAALSPETQNLIQQLYGNVGSTNAGFNTALQGTNALMGYQGQTVTPQTLAGMNLNPYMNPYTQAVINPSLTLMDQSLAQQQNQAAASARQTGAFGGSRQGVQEAVNNAQTNLLKGQLGANLWSQNFGQAQAAATGDIARNLAAQQSNQQYDFLGAQLRGQMANQYGNLTTAQQNNWLTGVTAAMGGQDVARQNQQDQLNAQMALYNEQRMDPVQRIQMRMNALTMSPYGRQTVATGPGPSTDPWMTGLGTAATVGGLMGSFGKMGLFGSGQASASDMGPPISPAYSGWTY